MTEQRIEPHKITKPIQLLAAWLIGLVLTNASFLVAAIQLDSDGWERGALIIAPIVNVPVFLLALFVLQTRFRAELQEDSFYAEYLSKKTMAVIRVDKNTVQDAKIEALERDLARLTTTQADKQSALDAPEDGSTVFENPDWSHWPVALNQIHPQFKEVREALRTASIPLTTIFGKASEGPPPKWIVSISHQLPLENKVHLLRSIVNFEFDGIQFWHPMPEAEEYEDVYIGSYGSNSYAQITPELTELLKNKLEAVDLQHYYSQNKVKKATPISDA